MKALRVVFIVVVLACLNDGAAAFASSTVQIIISGGGNVTAGSYALLFGQGTFAWNATENNRAQVWPVAGRVQNWSFTVGTAPGVGTSRTFTVRQNLASSTLSCTIADTATTCSDTAHVLTVAAGDLFDITTTSGGSPAANVTASWSVEFIGNVSGDGAIAVANTSFSTSATNYVYPFGLGSAPAATVTDSYMLMPLTATVTAVYCRVPVAPGAGTSWTFSLYLNGANQSSTNCVISGTNTIGSATGLSLALAPADVLSIQSVPAGTPTASVATVGTAIRAATRGQALLVGSNSNQPAANATSYNRVNGVSGSNSSWATTESTFYQFGGVRTMTISNLRISDYSGTPGVGQSFIFTLRKNTAAGAETCTISGLSASCTDATNADTITSADKIDLQVVASLTAALGSFEWAAIAFVPMCQNLGMMGAGC